jgi:hypothetical protein
LFDIFLPFLCRPKIEPRLETFKVGDTALTRDQIWEARIPYVDSIESRTDYHNAQPHWIRARADELRKGETSVADYCSSPAMQLVTAQATVTANLRKIQKRASFVKSAIQTARLYAEFTPEERQAVNEMLGETGALEVYQAFRTLDEKILQDPDPIKRADALAAAKVVHRKLSAGADVATAFAARNRVEDDRQDGRENLKKLQLTAEDVAKALATTNGNKSAAARLLKTTRNKIRYVLGEQ